MSFDDDKKRMQDRSLRQAIRFYGSTAKLAKALKVDPSFIRKILNENKKISTKNALKLERDTGIDFRYFSPYTEQLNQLIVDRERL